MSGIKELKVTWHIDGQKNIEYVNFDELLNAASGAIVTTRESCGERESPELVFWRAELTWIEPLIFSLKYTHEIDENNLDENGSYWGVATFTLEENEDKCSCTCVWDGQNTASPSPECEIVFPRVKELVKRWLRDQTFRKNLLSTKNGRVCAISGESNPTVLDAAHIVEVWCGGNDDVCNGLMLRKDIHALLDAGLFWICHESGNIVFDDVNVGSSYTALLRGKTIGKEIMSEEFKENLRKRNAIRAVKGF